MVTFKNLAIDGQKIAANANFRNNVDRARALEHKKAKLTQALAILKTLEDEKASVNRVDAEAKIMSHKDRRIVLSYN